MADEAVYIIIYEFTAAVLQCWPVGLRTAFGVNHKYYEPPVGEIRPQAEEKESLRPGPNLVPGGTPHLSTVLTAEGLLCAFGLVHPKVYKLLIVEALQAVGPVDPPLLIIIRKLQGWTRGERQRGKGAYFLSTFSYFMKICTFPSLPKSSRIPSRPCGNRKLYYLELFYFILF